MIPQYTCPSLLPAVLINVNFRTKLAIVVQALLEIGRDTEQFQVGDAVRIKLPEVSRVRSNLYPNTSLSQYTEGRKRDHSANAFHLLIDLIITC